MAKELNNVGIFAEGTWRGTNGTFKFVMSDLQGIVNNTIKLMGQGAVKPKLKLGHSDKQIGQPKAKILKGQTDGDPALGFLENIKLTGNKIVSDFKNVPDIIHQAITKGLYTNVSAELGFIENLGWFIRGVALLGADTPAVKTLDDLQAFLSESDEGSFALSFSEPSIDHTGDLKKMSDEKTSTLDLERKILDLEKKLQVSTDVEKELNTKVVAFSENEKVRLFTEKKKEFLTPYQDGVKKGELTPALFTKLEQAIEAQGANFSEGSELMLPQNIIGDLMKNFSEKMPEGVISTSEPGKGTGKPVDERVVMEVAKVQATNANLSFSDASDIMFAAQPELEKEYNTFSASCHGREV